MSKITICIPENLLPNLDGIVHTLNRDYYRDPKSIFGVASHRDQKLTMTFHQVSVFARLLSDDRNVTDFSFKRFCKLLLESLLAKSKKQNLSYISRNNLEYAIVHLKKISKTPRFQELDFSHMLDFSSIRDHLQ